jgi:hypothetical protein
VPEAVLTHDVVRTAIPVPIRKLSREHVWLLGIFLEGGVVGEIDDVLAARLRLWIHHREERGSNVPVMTRAATTARTATLWLIGVGVAR